MAEKDNLLDRAKEAATEVTRLKNEITALRVVLKKSKAEASSLRRQVIEALGPPKTRSRRKKAVVIPERPTCRYCDQPSVKVISERNGLSFEVCDHHADLIPTPAGKEPTDAATK